MPLMRPRSSSGNTFGRIRWKVRNISAVQRPMPRIATSSSMMASSSICCHSGTWTEPDSKCAARSTRYSTLRADRPAARITAASSASTDDGWMRVLLSGASAAKRSHAPCAAALRVVARRLLEHPERCGEALEQRGSLRRACAVELTGELEQHGHRARRVEVFVHRGTKCGGLRLRPVDCGVADLDTVERGIQAPQCMARVVEIGVAEIEWAAIVGSQHEVA